MQTPILPQARRELSGTRLGSVVFALLLTATLTAPAAQAAALEDPPAYPDQEHVANGCYVSTFNFLARFRAEFPGERGGPALVTLRNADGTRRSHTIALVSWQGEWWGRDEFFGVFALERSVAAHPDPEELAGRAGAMLEKQAAKLIRAAKASRPSAPAAEMPSEQRIREVTTAVRMVPARATVFWVKSGRSEVPVAFFRPTDRQIAVYDPLRGTSLAECACPDDAKVVAAVATRLGYRVDGVRAELVSPTGPLVASVTPPFVAAN